MAILAIDQGTSGTKSLVVSDDDEVLAISETPIRPDYLSDGGVEQDPEELWDSVIHTAQEAVAQAGVEINGVTLTNQGETVLAWDPKTAEPLSKMVVWQDRRADQLCRDRKLYGDMIASRTGLTLDPYFTAPKMKWLRDNITTEGVVTTSDTWMLRKLTGEFVTDTTTASRSLLTSLAKPEWNEELLNVFDLGAERMPRIVANDEIVGTTDLFGSEVPVAGVIVDQQGALVAQRCLTEGEGKCTFGTGAFMLVNAGHEPKVSHNGLSVCVGWKVDNDITYCFDGQVYTAASAVRWMQDLGIIEAPQEMDCVVAEEETDVLCVPAFSGLAAPWWRPDAKACITRMGLATGKGELVAAVLRGIAVQVAISTDLVAQETGIPIQRLRVDGGLTNSTFLVQAVADLLQVPVDVYPSAHATPLGGVAMARKAINGGSLADSIVTWEPSAVFEPVWSVDRAADYRARWEAALEANARK